MLEHFVFHVYVYVQRLYIKKDVSKCCKVFYFEYVCIY